jgi:cytochrome c556
MFARARKSFAGGGPAPPSGGGTRLAEARDMGHLIRNRASRVVVSIVGAAVYAVFSGACAGPARTQPPQEAQMKNAVATPARAEPPVHLSEAARAVLKTRMAAHARDMGNLVAAIMILDYVQIEDDARRIAGDASLSRPLTNDATELNASLPETFFVRQDELRTEAAALAQAAHALNPYRVAEVYGRLSEACVRCHADFRPGK